MKKKEMMKRCIHIVGKLYDKGELNEFIKQWTNYEAFLSKNSEIMVDDIVAFLDEHRVLQIAYENLKYINSEYSMKLQNKISANLNKWPGTSIKQLVELAEIIDRKKLLFIKGSSLSNLYPVEYTRYQWDIDVIVSNIDELWEIIEKLETQYYFDRLKLYLIRDNDYSASLDLLPKKKDLPPIDIHIAPYYIWGAKVLDVDLWEKEQAIVNLNCPSFENMLLILVAHIANQWMYRLRDINDLYLLSNKNLDWNYIYTMLNENNLLPIFNVLNNKISEVYGVHVEGIKKLKIYEHMFYRLNFGKVSSLGSTLIEWKVVLKSYEKMGFYNKYYNCLKNTINMVVYKNRAYKVNKKLKIKKWEANEIIVLKKATEKIEVSNYSRKLASEFHLYNEGKKTEYYKAPNIIFVPTTYHNKN